MKLIVYLGLVFIGVFIVACSAVPTTRYENQKPEQRSSSNQTQEEEIKQPEQKNIRTILNEGYDISRFAPQLNVNVKNEKSEFDSDKEIWYGFTPNTDGQIRKNPKEVVGTADGFRILVFSSDNLEDIEEIKLKVEEHKGIHQVYSIFEPPFYKIYIGDFSVLEDANSLRKKFLQLGFKESKVVRTNINIFK